MPIQQFHDDKISVNSKEYTPKRRGSRLRLGQFGESLTPFTEPKRRPSFSLLKDISFFTTGDKYVLDDV